MNIDRPNLPPIVYKTHDMLCVGDYGGAGAIGHANIDAILADARVADYFIDGMPRDESPEEFKRLNGGKYPRAIVRYSAYNSKQLFVRADVWRALELDSFDDYPCLDDGYTEIETEWEQAYLDDRYNAQDILLESVNTPLDDNAREALRLLGADDTDLDNDALDAVLKSMDHPQSVLLGYLSWLGNNKYEYPEFQHAYCAGDTCMYDQARVMSHFPEFLAAVPADFRREQARIAGQLELEIA